MEKQLKRIKFFDSLTVYLIALIGSLVINMALTPLVGVFARIMSCALVTLGVLFATKRTNRTVKNLLPTSRASVKNILGVSATLSGVILLSVPCVLFFHIIAPNFALTGFKILENLPGAADFLWVGLLIILHAAANTVLFEGYLWSGTSIFDKKWQKYLFVSAAYGIMFGDLYVLLPLIIFEIGILYVRDSTKNVKLSFLMQLFACSGAYALLQLSAKGSSFIGVGEGIYSILGMAMIFIGISMLLLWAATSLLNKKSVLTPFGKLMTVMLFIIFLAIGSGLASI